MQKCKIFTYRETTVYAVPNNRLQYTGGGEGEREGEGEYIVIEP